MKVLKGGRLIDGTGATPVNGATIVIRDDRIDAVTTRNQSDWPADAEIIDCAGLTVLPGLIDCHDHMANHRYDLAHRWGSTSRESTRHLRTAAVLKQYACRRLYDDPRRRRARCRLQARDRGGADRGAAAGAVAVDHLADRRDRRRGQPVGFAA